MTELSGCSWRVRGDEIEAEDNDGIEREWALDVVLEDVGANSQVHSVCECDVRKNGILQIGIKNLTIGKDMDHVKLVW